MQVEVNKNESTNKMSLKPMFQSIYFPSTIKFTLAEAGTIRAQ